MTPEELHRWWEAYCAALQGRCAAGLKLTLDELSTFAYDVATRALDDYVTVAAAVEKS